ncbi:MAG: Dabb family protein [Ruminococcus sp.]|nr:Dabb family protein [Ruminococcus sp.]
MIRHIIIWDLDPELTAEDSQAKKAEIKQGLEALVGVVPGLVSMSVRTDLLGSSKGDVLLDSVFESEAALAAYQTHPKHLAAAAVVKSVAVHRSCADIEI